MSPGDITLEELGQSRPNGETYSTDEITSRCTLVREKETPILAIEYPTPKPITITITITKKTRGCDEKKQGFRGG